MEKRNQPLGKSFQAASQALLVTGIIVTAANLRAAITGVGPLVTEICQNTGLSTAWAGMLTTLPLVAFAVVSPVAPVIARRIGIEFALAASMGLLTVGIVVRGIFSDIGLFVGMFLVGVGIAMGNVLLPSLVKRDFAARVGLMTGLYTISMSVWAAIASGISVPLSHVLHLGWRGSMMSWGILSIVCILVWLPQMRKHHIPQAIKSAVNVWKSGLAWQVTFFMGLQSFLFYVSIAWLPEILQSRGMSETASGWMLSLLQFVSLPASFVVPIVAGRRASQRGLVVFCSLLFLIGYAGLLCELNALNWLWVVLIGVAGGAAISLALSFFGLRSQSSDEAAKLSGMAQSVGYLMAAIGPALVGFLHHALGAWTVPLLMLIGITVLLFIFGMGAGRNAFIGRAEVRENLAEQA
ncbi:MFS transporter [Alicyclobacillus cycloheptanicus]|uniref:CP family cyanate transporter-like MFS transporter n=1 Tax=Alicyclobacillus cycloheptanicus TaxID=1457 RepID=A0ABT9XM38_9BACL|nr:MFS transporter [Alicyclobacillus cycloheptanicus]MDQ0191376.1 CP family cyanate transporter-like MFS transporter [Alicyclobacillus cycloheptanicus]WDM02359.1 MFS transporter [Alicyclobacillus cycloheptanicus]